MDATAMLLPVYSLILLEASVIPYYFSAKATVMTAAKNALGGMALFSTWKTRQSDRRQATRAFPGFFAKSDRHEI
jgi:hypothetical protein